MTPFPTKIKNSDLPLPAPPPPLPPSTFLKFLSPPHKLEGDAYHISRIRHTVLLPLFSSFKQIFHQVTAVDGCLDIGQQSLVSMRFLNQKQHEFLNIIIWYDKHQEHASFLLLTFRS